MFNLTHIHDNTTQYQHARSSNGPSRRRQHRSHCHDHRCDHQQQHTCSDSRRTRALDRLPIIPEDGATPRTEGHRWAAFASMLDGRDPTVHEHRAAVTGRRLREGIESAAVTSRCCVSTHPSVVWHTVVVIGSAVPNERRASQSLNPVQT